MGITGANINHLLEGFLRPLQDKTLGLNSLDSKQIFSVLATFLRFSAPKLANSFRETTQLKQLTHKSRSSLNGHYS